MARLLAFGGLGLAAISLAYQYLKDRRRAKVKAENARRFRADQDLGTCLSVAAVNTGHRPISITGFSIDYADGSVLSTGAIYTSDSDGHYGRIERNLDSDDLDSYLEDGESVHVYFDYSQIKDFMFGLDEDVKLDGIYAYDAENEKHKAKLPKDLRDKINKLGERDADSS